MAVLFLEEPSLIFVNAVTLLPTTHPVLPTLCAALKAPQRGLLELMQGPHCSGSSTNVSFVPWPAEPPWPAHALPGSICVGELVLYPGAQGVMGKSGKLLQGTRWTPLTILYVYIY